MRLPFVRCPRGPFNVTFAPMDPVVVHRIGIATLIASLTPCFPDGSNINPNVQDFVPLFGSCFPGTRQVTVIIIPMIYRPTSLTSVLCKVAEHIIYTCLVLEAIFISLHFNYQLRKNYSSETLLLCLTDDLFGAISHSSLVDCVCIDFAKAFGSVYHMLLVFKLRCKYSKMVEIPRSAQLLAVSHYYS